MTPQTHATISGPTARRLKLAPPPLTDRELQVLELASYGHGNRAIGDLLFLAENTIKSHMSRIAKRWGIHSRTGMVAYALRTGVIK